MSHMGDEFKSADPLRSDSGMAERILSTAKQRADGKWFAGHIFPNGTLLSIATDDMNSDTFSVGFLRPDPDTGRLRMIDPDHALDRRNFSQSRNPAMKLTQRLDTQTNAILGVYSDGHRNGAPTEEDTPEGEEYSMWQYTSLENMSRADIEVIASHMRRFPDTPHVTSNTDPDDPTRQFITSYPDHTDAHVQHATQREIRDDHAKRESPTAMALAAMDGKMPPKVTPNS